MGHVLVIDWRDVDADLAVGGTKLTIREGGPNGNLLNDGGKVNFDQHELGEAHQMILRHLDNAKGRFDNRKDNPPVA